jgi:aspartate ammonia-lyase
MSPVISFNLINSLTLLINYIPLFIYKCIKGIKPNQQQCKEYIDLNPSLATLLSLKVGYLKAAEIAKESLEKNKSVKQIAIEKGYISKKEAEKMFDFNKYIKCKNKKG